ncbi:MAG: hypothetical protein ACKPKO_28295, partial [Candidatus Fonsibacter sp.]
TELVRSTNFFIKKNISVEFQSSFRPVSVKFQSSFSQASGKLQSSFSQDSVKFQSTVSPAHQSRVSRASVAPVLAHRSPFSGHPEPIAEDIRAAKPEILWP